MQKNHLKLNKILHDLKIKKGDILMVHGDAGFLAQFKYKKDPINEFFEKLIKYIGKNGTILVPTFTTSFCKKKIFDAEKTKSASGLFGEKFRKRKNVWRIQHPIFSFSIIGRDKDYFNSSNVETCFGTNSLFDKFHQKNGKLIFLGSTFELVATFVHYIEQYSNVSYRYLKKFSGFIISKKKKRKVTTSYFVRNLKMNKKLITPRPLKKLLNKTVVGRYEMYSIESKILFKHCYKKIKENEFYLVK